MINEEKAQATFAGVESSAQPPMERTQELCFLCSTQEGGPLAAVWPKSPWDHSFGLDNKGVDVHSQRLLSIFVFPQHV